ncbi:MAG: T9SS type A sorting domain-containing protein, partial [Bacteroidia bacterium]
NGVNSNYSPSQSVTFLAGPYQDENSIDDSVGIGVNESLNGFGFGDGIIDNERLGLSHFMCNNNIGGNGPQALNYYYSLEGLNDDGTQLYYGSGNSIPADFIFPGNSDQQYYWGTNGTPVPPWSEESSSNTPYDRRGLGSSGPFTLQPEEIVPLDLAFVFGRDYNGGPQESITVMKERIDAIRSMFISDSTTCGGSISSVQQIISAQNKVVVYPNPVKDILTVSCSVPAKEQVIELFNVSGQKVITENVNSITCKTEINLSALTSGIYLLRISSQNEIIHVQKIIKN